MNSGGVDASAKIESVRRQGYEWQTQHMVKRLKQNGANLPPFIHKGRKGE
jgi:hypothetical protein